MLARVLENYLDAGDAGITPDEFLNLADIEPRILPSRCHIIKKDEINHR
jgi:hypothetical protein